MNLTWHMVRKDLRRLAWPVAGWLALLVGVAVWLRLSAWSPESYDTAAATNWVRPAGSLANAATLLAAALLVILAGVLGEEDRVTGADGGWTTRPVSGWRLLGAKLTAALLLFVVAPIGALSAVWWESGFSGEEWLRVAGATAGWLAAVAFAGLTLAALTRDLGQQAFAALLWLAAVTAIGTGLAQYTHGVDTPPELAVTRTGLGNLLPWLAAAIALGWQYGTRRTAGGWRVMIAGLVLPVAVHAAWPWEWSGGSSSSTAVESALRVDVKMPAASTTGDLPPTLILDLVGVGGETEWLAPVGGTGTWRWSDGPARAIDLERGARWAEQAAVRVAGGRRGDGPVRWEMAMRAREVSGERTGETAATFTGRLTLRRMRARVVEEIPWREGAFARAGSRSTRIVGEADGASVTLLIEEREAWSGAERGHDCFLLVQKPLGWVQALPIRELGSVAGLGLRLKLRALDVGPIPRAENATAEEIRNWRDGATLVRVSFESREQFERNYAALPVGSVAEEDKP